ncbi:MAG: SusC/RagA family TonB-linked outer membrane protein [Mucilaginibacter polytrichastri]|nr:SusC/RagA family TonB-linked outer membrane protein [Mucilaginibacter polytrichastri]
MKFYPVSRWLRRSLSVALILAGAQQASAQYAANFRKAARSNAPQQDERGIEKITLKQALRSLTDRYSVDFAYQKGLLEAYRIPAALIVADSSNVESKLYEYLEGLPLSFKKVNERQYAIFGTEKGTAAARKVSGKVLDETGAPVIGASIYLKSNPQNGTTTSETGQFSLNAPDAGEIVLVVAYVGYDKQEVPVNDPSVPVTVRLKPAANNLNEVVVTALGISREKKSLGYAVSEVKGSELTQARENNVANALTGKVAGVNVAGLSTGPGGSSRVTIRGNGSLSGNNQPLYVINGMPIDNSVPGGAPTINGITTNVDRGDGIAAINPDDIESMSVLKGGPAAALYGARAANGVILITTKKGRAQQGVGVELSSVTSFENATIFPDFQYEYGQGDNGIMPTTLNAAQATGRQSFGARIDGNTDYVAADGLNHPYTAQRDNIKNFYQTGLTTTNTVAVTGGSEGINYRVSASNLYSKGILPRTTYDRKTLNVSVNAKPGKKLTVEAVAQYNLERGRNRTGAGDALGNPNWLPLEVANTVDVRWLAPGYDANGNETVWNDAAIASNGYFVINKFQQRDDKNRFIGQGSVAYEPVENLILKGSLSRDFYSYDYTNIMPTGTLYVMQGEYAGIRSETSETNALATLSYSGSIGEDFNYSVLGGANSQRFQNNQVTLTGRNFSIPYYYSYTNLASLQNVPFTGRTGINSLFGSADFDYKSLIFLTLSGRNDWFSTLSPQNNNIFYPSVGTSFILSDAVKLPAMFNLAKIRASFAQVGGGGPDPYTINLAYNIVPSGGPTLQNVSSNDLTNPALKPYTSTTYEGGIELQMLQNRLGLDLTFYDRKTTNDIVRTAISNTSGYNTFLLNVGELRNRGIEALVTGSPVKKENFGWNMSYNIAYNQNRVIKLADGLSSIQLASSVGNWAYFNHIEGQPFGAIVGTRIRKDASGNTVYNSTSNRPVPTELQNLGQSVAPLTMGLTNDFRYKNFSLNVLLDGKFGNKVFSVMEIYATRLGLMKSTLPGRENGLELNGVDQAGAPYSATIPVTGLRGYYNDMRNYSELFIHDGSFIKLRQIILSYNLPKEFVSKLKLQNASVSLVARNLAILYRKTDNFDPEQSFTNSNIQGFESIGLPRTRSMGFNLNVKF